MTALAASLFALAALVSIHAIITTLHRHGRTARALRAQLESCPGTLTIEWARVERITVPALVAIRRDRPVRQRPVPALRPGLRLEWPAGDLAA